MTHTAHDAQRTIRNATQDTAEQAAHFAVKAGESVDQAVQYADRKAREVAEQASEVGEQVSKVAGNMRSAIDKSVNEQPMTTLLMAAAVGFVLGALWKS
ncbi:MAG: DUF883 family protein [Beijerinckiaceae bacterium]